MRICMVYGRNVPVSDKLFRIFKECTGYELTQLEIEAYIETYYMGDFMHPETDNGLTVKEAARMHSGKEFAHALENQLMLEMRECYGYDGTAARM